MFIGREFHIDSAHQLPGHPRCGTLHGHTYRIAVELGGAQDERGMILDFADLRRETEAFLEHLDHVYLNDVLEKPPTVENIADYIFQGLKERLPGLTRVKVWEGHGKYAEVGEPR
ncbi:MAG: 6-carboxytetrahydropterin synthase [Acidobacteriota bacterium]